MGRAGRAGWAGGQGECVQDRQGARRSYPSVGVAPSSSAAASPSHSSPPAVRNQARFEAAGRQAGPKGRKEVGGLATWPQKWTTGGPNGRKPRRELVAQRPAPTAHSLRRPHSSPHRRPVLPSQPFSDTPCGAVGGWRATRLEAATARCSTSLLPFGRSTVFYGYASPVPGHKSNADQALRNLQIGKGGGSPTARNQNPSLRSESHHKGATDANATGGR